MNAGARYLLDTNVVSETRKVRADAGVMSFLSGVDPSGLFISVLTVGELRRGLEARRRRDPQAAVRLGAWVDDIEGMFADRILPIDTRAARLWGEISADRSRPVIDTLVAATALTHDLTLVTRNAHDVQGLGARILDPWQAPPAPEKTEPPEH